MEVSAMPVNVDAGELPVTLLFNLDPVWTPPEREEAQSVCRQLRDTLATIGHPTTIAYVQDDRLEELLAALDPSSGIVFNWCESLPGVRHSEGLVARILESRGFVFTGSDAAALELSQDKARIKKLLVEEGIPTPSWRVYHRPEHSKWETFPAIVKPVNEHASEGIKTLLPAPLAADELRMMEDVCCAAYSAASCRDYGRVDLRLRDGQPYVLDVNPNADISADASFACAAEVCGYSYGQLGSRIVRLAARRHPVWGDSEKASCSTVSS
jgi:D-alanine-D-alanine ligase-like ATP-grasp enzyme